MYTPLTSNLSDYSQCSEYRSQYSLVYTEVRTDRGFRKLHLGCGRMFLHQEIRPYFENKKDKKEKELYTPKQDFQSSFQSDFPTPNKICSGLDSTLGLSFCQSFLGASRAQGEEFVPGHWGHTPNLSSKEIFQHEEYIDPDYFRRTFTHVSNYTLGSFYSKSDSYYWGFRRRSRYKLDLGLEELQIRSY